MCGCTETLAQLAALEDRLNTMDANMGAFTSGHPILMFEHPDDVVEFDLVTGEGSGHLFQWALCDGGIHSGVQAPDLRDKFVVGAGLSYAVDDTGGANTVTLDATMIPSHTHVLTDPGHNHIATQVAHNHGVTDPGHTHAVSQVAHSHAGTTSTDGDHTHPPGSDVLNSFVTSDNNGTFLAAAGPGIEVNDSDTIGVDGSHSHTITTDAQTPAITAATAGTLIAIQNATPAITVNSDTTGITIANTGGGLAHENRPPYYALIFAIKVK